MDGHRPMREVVDSMLHGEFAGCLTYLSRQSEAAIPAFLNATKVLKGLAEELWLQDPDAFMRHKFRTPDEPLSRAVFQAAIEHVMQARHHEARQLLAPLTLDELGLVATVHYRLEEAYRQLRHAPVLHGRSVAT